MKQTTRKSSSETLSVDDASALHCHHASKTKVALGKPLKRSRHLNTDS